MNNEEENQKGAVNSLADFTKKNHKKMFILDLVLGVGVVAIGLYYEITWLAIFGAIGLAIGLLNPNKYLAKKLENKRNKKI